ncbi:MAG TPA: methyltransferase [Trueperaceae bacterium]|nr:methyltransferase [Trueperaceae bacterium]
MQRPVANQGSTKGDRYFAEVVSGIEDMAVVELAELGGVGVEPGDGGLRLRHPRPAALMEAGMVAAVYRELRFDVPRPKALLGDAAARQLTAAVSEVAHAARPSMRSFRLAAAGSDSSVFRRLAAVIQTTTSLREDQVDGELLVRVRPYREGVSSGWEALVRLTSRPLSTRAWRVCNRPGGLNATVAVALNEMLGLDRRGGYLNLMCGSGTLLVERALAGPHGRLVGVDIDQEALECTATNLAAAGVGQGAELVTADIADPTVERRLREAAGSDGGFAAIAADVPWGDAVGSHAANLGLHRSASRLAAGLLARGGRFGVVSHEVRLLRQVFELDPLWRVVSRRQVAHGGHNPVVLVLERV